MISVIHRMGRKLPFCINSNTMKMKTSALAKTAALAALLAGTFCWSAAAGDATELWAHNCAACHGKDGMGQTMMGNKLNIKDLTYPKIQASFTDEQATKTIKEGFTDQSGMVKMKAFTDKLSDDEIKDLVAKVRSFKAAK